MSKVKDIQRLINEAKNQPLVICALSEAASKDYRYKYNNRGTIENISLSKIRGTQLATTKPSYTSVPLKYLFKYMTNDEYVSGVLGDKTRKKVIDAINRRRGEIKSKLKTKPKDKKTINEYKRLKVRVYRSIHKTLTSFFSACPPKSRTSIKKAIQEFRKRSKSLPVNISEDPVTLANCDYVGGKCLYDDRKNTDNIFSVIMNGNRAVATIGDDGIFKTARAVVGRFRKFKRGEGNVFVSLPYLAIIDIHGPIRQQKKIVQALLTSANKTGLKLFMPSIHKHKFRCDFKFGACEKIIDAYDRPLPDSYTRYMQTTDDNSHIKKPSYPGGISYVTKSQEKDLHGQLVYIIPEAVHVERRLKPDEFKAPVNE